MIKILSTLLLASSIAATAQVSVAAKAHLLFPTGSASWKSISASGITAKEQSGKNNVGFNIGLSTRISLPMSIFIMPELYYTSFKNEFVETWTNTKLEAKSNRLDLPVLVGYNLWGETLGAFVGPVASYNFGAKKENYYSDGKFAEEAKKNYSVGYQFGVQAKISKLIIDARYEGAFTKDQREFFENVADANTYVRYDNRPSLLLLGIGYKF